MAIKDKVTEPGQMAALLPRLPGLAVAMANSVQTDMPDRQGSHAGAHGRQDGPQQHRARRGRPKMGQVIQNDPQLGYTLVPDLVKVRAAADAIFADAAYGPSHGRGGAADDPGRRRAHRPAQRHRQEKGLASRLQAKLVTEGFDITTVGNADRADYGAERAGDLRRPKAGDHRRAADPFWHQRGSRQHPARAKPTRTLP